MPALTVPDVARELGRAPGWLYDNWQRLVSEKKIPPPIIEAGGLTWSAAQLYAYLDKPLTPAQRAIAAAYRAAHDAAAAAPRNLDEQDEIEASRARLDQKRKNRETRQAT